MEHDRGPLGKLDEMMRDDFPDILTREITHWFRTLSQQFDRVMNLDSSEEERMRDLMLFPLCLRAVLRIANLAAQIYNSDRIRQALAEFDQQVPHAVELRNILEHYDDYLLGKGRLQRRGPDSVTPANLAYNMSRTYLLGGNPLKHTCILTLGGLSLNTREATLSALALASIVLGVLKENNS